MGQKIPPVKKGDVPYASDYNRMAEIVSRLPGQFNINGKQVGHKQYTVEVSEVGTGGDEGICKCKILWYDPRDAGASTKGWTKEDEEFTLDVNAVPRTYHVEDRLTVWWDKQRGCMVPCEVVPRTRLYAGTTTGAVASEDMSFMVSGLAANDSGSVPEPDSGSGWTVYNDQSDVIETATEIKIVGYADGTLHTLHVPNEAAESGAGIRFFSGVLPSALTSTTASLNCTLTAIDGGDSPVGVQEVINPRDTNYENGLAGKQYAPFIAIYDESLDAYRFLQVSHTWIRMYQGTLPEDLTPQTEYLYDCTLTAIDGDGSPSGAVQVWNIRDSAGHGGLHGKSGAAFRAVYNQYSSRFEFVYVAAEPMIRFFKATAVDQLKSTSAGIKVAYMTALDGYSVPPYDSEGGQTWNTFNDMHLACAASKNVYITQSADGRRVITNCEQGSQTVVTAEQVTSTTLQVKTRTEVGMFNDEESGWTTIDTFTTSCPE